MELNEIIQALENCHNIACDMCPLRQEGVHCMTNIAKLLRQEAIKISAANKEIQDLKEEIEELKQENVELDEKLHKQPKFYVTTSPIKTPYEKEITSCEEEISRWAKSTH